MVERVGAAYRTRTSQEALGLRASEGPAKKLCKKNDNILEDGVLLEQLRAADPSWFFQRGKVPRSKLLLVSVQSPNINSRV